MKIDVNKITLNYSQEGNGRPLLLLHGNGEDHRIFDKLMDKLKQDFTVYAIDSRNHGESTQTDDFSYDSMAEDIYQFIERKQLKDVSIIGFSDGAIISTLLAIKHPGIFNKMALLGINLKPTDFKKEIYDYLVAEYEKNKDPLIRMMLEEPNIELEDIKDITIPTLVVMADDDLYNEEMFHNIVNVMPNATLMVMEGHDHGSYIMNQDILYPDLKAFLQ